MDVAYGLTFRLKQILSKLKLLNIVRSYTLKIDFGRVGEDVKDCLVEVNALLRKCVKRIRLKPRRAEIRNVIGELVRKKNTKRLKDKQTNIELATESRIEELKCQKSELDKGYLCEFCGVKFIYYSNLKVHILKVHESGRTFKSNKSNRLMSSQDGLNDHLRSDNNIDDIFHPVNHGIEGNPIFRSSENARAGIIPEGMNCKVPDLIRDEDIRSGNDMVVNYPCPQSGCQRIFRKQGSLKKHIRLKHGANIQYRCSRCDKIFFEKGKLNRHVLTHQQGQFQCSQCHRIFHRKDNLKRHIALHQENADAFECRFCKKRFSLKFNRDTHEINVHTNVEIHCDSCGKKCKNEGTLKVHKRLHENRICCNLCCKTFTRKAQYRNHLKNKHKGLSPFQKLFDSFAVLGPNSPS